MRKLGYRTLEGTEWQLRHFPSKSDLESFVYETLCVRFEDELAAVKKCITIFEEPRNRSRFGIC